MTLSITNTLAAAAIAGGALFLPFSASAADLAAGDYLGKTAAEVSAALESRGFVIKEIEREDGILEVEVEKTASGNANDAAEFEFEIAQATGEIVKVEIDD